jgi:adenosine/AMP kinase
VRITTVSLKVPEGLQIIIGQSHFIKTVEYLYEALVTSSPGIRFGVAFCEASGKALVRFDGSDQKVTELAKEFALMLGAGHSFVIVLQDSFPINVLNRVKSVEEVVSIYCATSNNTTVIVAEENGGRGIIGVIDGISPKGSESDDDRAQRHDFLRKVGYKR